MRIIGGLLLTFMLAACGQATTAREVALGPGTASEAPAHAISDRDSDPVASSAPAGAPAMGMCATDAPDCNDMVVDDAAPDGGCIVSYDGTSEQMTCPDGSGPGSGAAGGGTSGSPGTGQILCEGGKPTTSAPPGTDCSVPEPPAGRDVKPAPGGLSAVRPIGWDRFTVRGRRLTVHWYSGVAPCSVLHSVDVRERARQVVVTLREGSADEGAGCIAIAEAVKTTVTLDRPLGTRKVIDGADG